ncbi:MAG: AAA domain-containing protein [Thermoplasmatota archaeon]
MRGRARDVAQARAKDQEGLVVVQSGPPVREALVSVPLSGLPEPLEDYPSRPSGWLLAEPDASGRAVMRLATVAFKALGEPGHVEDTVVLPVPADLCRVPPWDERWRAAAVQLDRVVTGLLLAEDPAAALPVEDLEVLVGAALALRGLPAEQLYKLSPVVEQAAAAAHTGAKVSPDEVRSASRAHGGLAAALLVGAHLGPLALLRLAHPRFTPTVPDLPHPALLDARRHAWRGKAFATLANAASRGDLVTAWGRFPELRFVFPSSQLLEAATDYCRAHRLKGPLDDADLKSIPDRTRTAPGDRDAAEAVLKEWRDALGLAEEHEREFLADLHARQPERERRREGMALPDLRVVETKPDLVRLESTSGRFPNTNISPGSEVALVPVKEREEIARGLVSRIDHRRLTIEFPAGAPRHLPRNVTVNLTFDAKVFEAYHSAVTGALRAMQASQPHDDGPDGLIQAALLGETDPPASLKQSLNMAGLTPSQKASIDAVLSGGRVRLIHGPPGTGKTHTLTHLAMALSRAGHSVLVTADSNAAVDNMVVGLRRAGALVVRVGHAPNIRDEQALPARIDPLDAPKFVRWAADAGVVVATTNYGAYRYIDPKGGLSPFIFDYVIHDEAGQSTAPSSLAAAMRGRRLVLAGDPLQLPPTVVSMDAKDAGLDVTLFERIEKLTGRERTRLLATQFRMREPIVAFSNQRYYEGRIETAKVAAEQEGLEELPAAAFQHVTGKENPRQRNGSISNDWEVEAVVALVEKFRSAVRERGWTMAVLTPYQAQREMLRRRMPDVEVSTVDGAQGREWDLVFYSSVRSNPQHRLGFVADERRLNVAVTRARRHYVLVGDERTLRDNEGLSLLLDTLEKVRFEFPRPQPRQQRGGRGGGGGGGGRGPRGGQANQGGQGGQGGKRRRRRRGKRGGQQQQQGQGQDQGQQPGGQPPQGGAESEGPPKKKRRRRRRRRKPSADGEGGAPQQEGQAPKQPREAKASVQKPKKQADGSTPKPKAPAKPKAKPSSAKTSAGAPKGCAAKTKAGSPCRNKAKPGGRFCGVHGG